MKSIPSFCLALLILCATQLGIAQSTNATLSGVVLDPIGRVIQNAEIQILNEATGVQFHGKTNEAGIYTVSVLPPGQYRVEVSKVGFKTLIKPGIVLNVQSAVALNFTLPLGATSESITVEGGASAINVTDGSVSTVIDRDFVENMPLNGRSFQDLLTLSPGVAQVSSYGGAGEGSIGYAGDIVVNGQRTEANNFTVDGVSANTGTQPGTFGAGAGVSGNLASLTSLGTTQSITSIDTLQEFRTTTSTYSAEYGRSPGGQFSFSTRSGTNRLHGSLYDYLRNDAFDANNWFNDYYSNPKGKERQNDFGGTLGGPVFIPRVYDGKNATFFFFSYEGLRLDSPQAAAPVEVPDDTLRQQAPASLQALLNAFPLANGGEDGSKDGFAYFINSISYPSYLNNTSVRVDHRIRDRLSLFGRYADTPSEQKSYVDAVQVATGMLNRAATLGATYNVTPHQSNDLRFNFTQSSGRISRLSTSLGGATPLDLGSLPGPSGSGFPVNNSELIAVFTFADFTSFTLGELPSAQHQLNVTDTHTWIVGKHNIKAGFDWRRLFTALAAENPVEEVAFTNQSQVLQNTPIVAYAQAFGGPQDEPIYTNVSSFLQDEWKVTPRLALSLGLRWDVNPAPTNANGSVPYTVNQVTDLSTTELAPQGTPLWKTDWHGIAPRFGVAYQVNPAARRSTVLRAGFGIFYDPGNADGSAGYQGIGYSSSQRVSAPSFPLSSQQLTLSPPSVATPYETTVFGFDPNLKLPYSLQYSAAVEQTLSKSDTLTFSYVGSGARKLLATFLTYPGEIGNPNFAPGTNLNLTQGRASSSYNSFQTQYQRNVSHGLQALVSYTWSHSIDDASNNFQIYYLYRASSDFDIRQNLQAAVTYLTPGVVTSKIFAPFLKNWGLDFRVQARSALPVDIIGTQTLDAATGVYLQYQPNLVAGQPLYQYGHGDPGGRVINYNAFQSASDGIQGDLPRNYARGFDAIQLDTAIRREFSLHDEFRFQFRAEAFNIFNHAVFGSIYNNLAYGPALFGHAYSTLNNSLGSLDSLYQVGGPRSLQLSLKLQF